MKDALAFKIISSFEKTFNFIWSFSIGSNKVKKNVKITFSTKRNLMNIQKYFFGNLSLKYDVIHDALKTICN